ncbi:MAG: hypothetical protein HY316_01595, partial [Acidobacteria bacterium]|nr:hypothetical protein [Acidobacteriota bacterium]
MRKGQCLCLAALALAFVSFAKVQAQTVPPEVAQHGYADSIVVNGKIVSMDDKGYNANPGRIYQALAVKGTRLIALGTNDYIRTLANQNTKVYDVGGRLVLPAIIDGHAHHFGGPAIAKAMGIDPMAGGRAINVQAARDMEGTRLRVENAIKENVAQMQPGQWLQVGINANQAEGTTGSKIFAWTVRGELENPKRLDPISPKNPVMISVGTRRTMNTVALDLLRKLYPSVNEASKMELPDLDDPTATGQVGLGVEAAIQWEIWLKDQPTPLLAEMVRRDWEMMAAHGQNVFGSRAYNPRIVETVSYLNRTKTAPIRYMLLLETHRRPNDPKTSKEMYSNIGSLWGIGDDMMWIGGVSSELWDSSFPLMCFGKDLPAPPEIKIREMCREPGNLFWDAMVNALGSGWRAAGFHGVASDGVRRYTQMIEQAMKQYNISVEDIRSRRMTTDHFEAVGTLPDVMAKVKELGIIVSANPSRMARVDDYIRDYGPGVEKFIQPAKTWLDAGITVVGQFEGYRGIGRQMKLYIDREVNGRKVLPDQALDRVVVLKMWTT